MDEGARLDILPHAPEVVLPTITYAWKASGRCGDGGGDSGDRRRCRNDLKSDSLARFHLFTGLDAPLDLMRQLVKKALSPVTLREEEF